MRSLPLIRIAAALSTAGFRHVARANMHRPHSFRAFRSSPPFSKEKESKITTSPVEVLPSMSDLMVASLQGDEEEVRGWLDEPGELSAKDMDGRTALIYAVQPGHEHIVRLLLDAGADANVKDRDGKSALTCAALWSRLGVMKQLIEAGAHLEAFDAVSFSTLPTAASPQDQDQLRVEKEGFSDALQASGERIAIVTNRPLQNGATALMYAAFKGNTDAARVLLEADANPDATDLEGRTALMLAAAQGMIDVAKVLVEHGAQKDRKDLQGWSAAQFASNGNHEQLQRWLQSSDSVECS